jgi:hypothetical protein
VRDVAALDRDVELHVALEGGDGVALGAGVNLAGLVVVDRPRHADLGLVGDHGVPAGDPHGVHLQLVGVAGDLGQAAGEDRRQAVGLGLGDAGRLGAFGQSVQRVEALIQGKELLVIVAGARQVELGGALVDEAAPGQGLLDELIRLEGGRGRRPRWRRGILGLAVDDRARTRPARGRKSAGARLVVPQEGAAIDRDDHGGPGRSSAPKACPTRAEESLRRPQAAIRPALDS